MNYKPCKLFKKTSTGKIQEWSIEVEGNIITRSYGQVGGKIQTTREEINVGKNIGRSNETTPEQQACMEASSEWKSKLDKNYYNSIKEAEQQTTVIAKEGGYLPMLAQDYKKHGIKHLKFPCIIQPKLDGVRAISTKENGIVKLWFRSGKLITTVPHINEQLNLIMLNGEILDGELYIHNMEFNSFTGSIRANVNLNEQITDQIQYHIYDTPRIGKYMEIDSFNLRFNELSKRLQHKDVTPHLHLVETHVVNSFEEAKVHYLNWLSNNYEGMMFRNINMPYEQKRSYNLLKYKDFDEEEFKIIDYVIDERKFYNNGIEYIYDYKLVCITESGIIFGARMKGNQADLAKMFVDPESLKGKYATVQFFGYTPDGSLRFPVSKTIRFDK